MSKSSSGGKGIPRKAGNPQRKVRRGRNAVKQPERKLRHILKRNTLREAVQYAESRNMPSVLRKLRPDYERLLKAGVR